MKADYKAASFAQDVAERRRMQSESLSAVFQTFFRVLKHAIQPRYVFSISHLSLLDVLAVNDMAFRSLNITFHLKNCMGSMENEFSQTNLKFGMQYNYIMPRDPNTFLG